MSEFKQYLRESLYLYEQDIPSGPIPKVPGNSNNLPSYWEPPHGTDDDWYSDPNKPEEDPYYDPDGDGIPNEIKPGDTHPDARPGGPMKPGGYGFPTFPGSPPQYIPYYQPTPGDPFSQPPTKPGPGGGYVVPDYGQDGPGTPGWVKDVNPRPTHDFYGKPIQWL